MNMEQVRKLIEELKQASYNVGFESAMGGNKPYREATADEAQAEAALLAALGVPQ